MTLPFPSNEGSISNLPLWKRPKHQPRHDSLRRAAEESQRKVRGNFQFCDWVLQVGARFRCPPPSTPALRRRRTSEGGRYGPPPLAGRRQRAMEFIQRAIFGNCGVGINISREAPFTVQLLHEGRSAHRSGLIKPGDVIVSIAGESLQVLASPLSPRRTSVRPSSAMSPRTTAHVSRACAGEIRGSADRADAWAAELAC